MSQLREQQEEHQNQRYRLQKQDEDLPMDLGSLQDIFTFKFFQGRPIANIIMAILWSIGLPILLYQLLKPRLGQVVAMIIASCPPLVIVISRMIKSRTLDVLGFVAGVSFLITGIISIAQPSPAVSSICESIAPLLIGVFCILSLFPIKIGTFELRPLVFQITNQLMPRPPVDEKLAEQDEQRLQQQQQHQQKQQINDKSKTLNWVYTHMAKVRNDLRILTACWGTMLIVGFIIKAIIASTNTDISKAQNFGYIFFTVATVGMVVVSWLFTKIMKRHVKDEADNMQRRNAGHSEGYENAQWGIQAMSTGFNQIVA
ncbi:unnamed protein product [Mucor circinelloides]|uniref:Uncharacterized protein n=1 Tax=Mucor circinelloides f. circinelloides (strain 1006PhL) TaxID=1220926 RepID=S2JW19_MUCC1|nr:hypothetical protein HMPREF1544_09234 [Mucor circinelloides 1006PhL]